MCVYTRARRARLLLDAGRIIWNVAVGYVLRGIDSGYRKRHPQEAQEWAMELLTN